MIKGIKHIIFDLGGVLINLDYELSETAFIELGISNFPEIYSQLKQTTLFDDFEIGKISSDDFIKGIRKISQKELSDKQITDAWNAMLLDFPLRRLQLLQQLRIHYDLILLSNTNEIHERAFNKILMDAHGMPNIGVFFDKVYLSHRIGMRKPDKEVFERILNENQLQASDTLFIDDSPQHIEGAKTIGIQTIFLEKGMTIEKDIFLSRQ
ncbi:MAG: HAD family phosphatase [Bacteroidetes bacterium]|nr:HAD family phosphatase [Bacteroidota bacterium]